MSKKTETNRPKTLTVLGLPLYKKWRADGRINRQYLGLFTVCRERTRTTYYLCGARLFSRQRNVLKNLERHVVKLENRINDMLYNTQVLVQVPVMHAYIKAFKRIHEGRDIVIIASGPSLKYYEAPKDAIHCGINGSVRLFEHLDYLFVSDRFLNDASANYEFDTYTGNNCKKFYGVLPQRRLRELDNYYRNQNIAPELDRIPQINIYNAKAFQFLLEDIYRNKWAVDLEQEALGDFGGTVFAALQFVLYTHPKKIYLAGCDVSTGYAYASNINIDYAHQLEGWKSFKNFTQRIYPDVEIVSINPVNLKGYFNDVYTTRYANAELTEKERANIQILN